MLSLRDTLRRSTRESFRWRHRKSYALQANSFGRTYKNQKVFLVHEWRVSVENRLIILRLLCAFSTRRSTSKSGTRKDCLLLLRSSATSTFKCLIKDTPRWRVIMSTNLKSSGVQDGREKGTLSNQPQLTCITPTALLGSWELQPIKDMTSLRTDFEMHANWQGYVEVPAGKDFVPGKVCTIALNDMQGTHWKAIKCQERLGNHPEAVVRQATIKLIHKFGNPLRIPCPSCTVVT